MILYRPTGIMELGLIFDAQLRGFPPRLPDQPIFYPVLNRGYAVQIARDWNSRSGNMAGFVTRFEVEDHYAARFERRVVGRREHEELWVPAEELEQFNARILSDIEIIDWFFGESFTGFVPESGPLAGCDANRQPWVLHSILRSSREAFAGEIGRNARVIFLHLPFWESPGPGIVDLDRSALEELTREIRGAWSDARPLPHRTAP